MRINDEKEGPYPGFEHAAQELSRRRGPRALRSWLKPLIRLLETAPKDVDCRIVLLCCQGVPKDRLKRIGWGTDQEQTGAHRASSEPTVQDLCRVVEERFDADVGAETLEHVGRLLSWAARVSDPGKIAVHWQQDRIVQIDPESYF